MWGRMWLEPCRRARACTLLSAYHRRPAQVAPDDTLEESPAFSAARPHRLQAPEGASQLHSREHFRLPHHALGPPPHPTPDPIQVHARCGCHTLGLWFLPETLVHSRCLISA